MMRHKLNVVAVVFNDNAYGDVRRFQKEELGGRLIASDLSNPDFVKLAESYGIEGVRTEDPDALRRALRAALERDRPALIEVAVGQMPSPWPILEGA